MGKHREGAFGQFPVKPADGSGIDTRRGGEIGNSGDQFPDLDSFERGGVGGKLKADPQAAGGDARLRQPGHRMVAGAGTGLAQDPVRALQIGNGDRMPGKGMSGSGIEADAISADNALRQQVFFHLGLDEADIRIAGHHQRGCLRGIADGESEADMGIVCCEPRHAARQPISGHRLAGGNAHTAARQPGQIVQYARSDIRPGQNLARCGKEQLAGFAQFEPAADPMEELGGMTFFQYGDGRADRRLRQMQPLRRARHAERFGHRDENLELIERHSIVFHYYISNINRLDLSFWQAQVDGMKAVAAIRSVLPGLALCCAVAAASLLLERAEVIVTGESWLEALVIAILLGSIVRTAWTPSRPLEPGIQCAAKTMLEMAVVLMGATVSFGAILTAGLPLLLVILATVVCAIVASFLLGRLLGLPVRMALLVACGNAICGNSAIAAIAPVIEADSEDVATSIAFTAVLGIAVVVALPFLARHLGLTSAAGGILAGLTVYAVPQVLAAAGPMGGAAVQLGTLVKLVRVLMLGPIVAGLSLLMARRTTARNDGLRSGSLQLLVPPFILAFIGLAAVHSLGWLPEAMAAPARDASGLLTVLAMAGLGLGVDLRSVSAAGSRVVVVVTVSLLLLGVTAYVLMRAANLA